ncbi:MAG: MCP four helix bundle domain-containing protein [Proteobacteria bacterium]|nr:MCP four helix bundle domain-containing protein [Pseudomonadota bacterium]
MAIYSLKSMMRVTYALILLGFGTLGFVAVNRLQLVSDQSNVMNAVWTPRVHTVDEMTQAASQYRISEALRILSVSPEMAAHADNDLKANADEFHSKVTAYRALLQKGEATAAIDGIEQAWGNYKTGNDQMLAFAHNNQQADATARFRNSASRFYLLTSSLDELSAADQAHGAQASNTAKTIFEQARRQLLLSLGIVALLLFSLAAFFEVRVWGALAGLSQAMKTLANGDFATEVKWTARQDEIGDMARTVKIFKDNGIEMRRLEAETVAQRQAAEEERRQNDETLAQAQAQRSFVVQSVAKCLEELSGGNLTTRLTEPFAAEFQKLQNDFNLAMDRLQDTMKIISTGAVGIHSNTEEISKASDKLAQRTENQAATLEETAAALEQLTAGVSTSAGSAKQAKLAVATTKADAEQSGIVVRGAVAAMSEIEKSSEQISEIIGVMDGIAFQTNLLALNAGVEAARAGEAGRGFAVVASEVRALAQRSTVAAKEIKALISSSTKQVEAGVDLVDQTGKALERIVTQVAQINGAIGEIAAAAEEQAMSLVQINTSVTQMDKVTQQNAAMAEESTAASHALAEEVNELARLINQFQLGTVAMQSPSMQAPSVQVPSIQAPSIQAGEPKVPAQSVALRAAKAGAILRTLSSGSAATARKLEAAIDHESWEEF